MGYEYYQLKLNINKEHNKYMVSELEKMTGRARSELIRKLLGDYFSAKLHEEENNHKGLQFGSTKESDSQITEMLAHISRQMNKMQEEQDRLAKENLQLIEEMKKKPLAEPIKEVQPAFPLTPDVGNDDMDVNEVPMEALSFLSSLNG